MGAVKAAWIDAMDADEDSYEAFKQRAKAVAKIIEAHEFIRSLRLDEVAHEILMDALDHLYALHERLEEDAHDAWSQTDDGLNELKFAWLMGKED